MYIELSNKTMNVSTHPKIHNNTQNLEIFFLNQIFVEQR